MDNSYIKTFIIKCLKLNNIRNGKYQNSDKYLKNDIKKFNNNSTIINNMLQEKQKDDLTRYKLLEKIESLTNDN